MEVHVCFAVRPHRGKREEITTESLPLIAHVASSERCTKLQVPDTIRRESWNPHHASKGLLSMPNRPPGGCQRV